MKKPISLAAPESYLRATGFERREVCNGVGPKGWGWIVPDTVYGLSITPAADIHDWMYYHGDTIEAKDEADRTFQNNMVRLICEGGSWFRWLRMRRARKMYLAVHYFGGPAFWANKTQPMNQVTG